MINRTVLPKAKTHVNRVAHMDDTRLDADNHRWTVGGGETTGSTPFAITKNVIPAIGVTMVFHGKPSGHRLSSIYSILFHKVTRIKESERGLLTSDGMGTT